MITLITGSPGSGKTLWAVAHIQGIIDENTRPLYVAGIPTLQLTHDVLDDPLQWHDVVPSGSLVVVDECQTYWRPRSTGKEPPQSIQRLETHRHMGIDFVLITQSPMLIDPNIRRLITRHIHLHQTFAGRWSTEWAECQTDPTRLGNGIRSRYSLPKRAMSHYQSAEIHHKPKFKIPIQIYLLPVLVLAVVGMGWFVYDRIKAKTQPQKAEVPVIQQPSQSPPSTAVASGNGSSGQANSYDFAPRQPYKPETAPAYDLVRKVSDFPRLSGCVASKDQCRCYTHTGTIYPSADGICRAYVRSLPFDPYRRQEYKTRPKPLDLASSGEPRAAPPGGERQQPAGGAAQVEPPMLGGGKPFIWEKGIH